jgi:EAL domain-containing protein (putative c-di-GMP-specific phosphodiesterase class I)
MVKLDRSLISGVSTSPQQYDLARSIFGLMKSAELQVVAEGIETNVQVAHLRSLHCRFGQGFFLGRPTEADKFKVQFLQGRPV